MIAVASVIDPVWATEVESAIDPVWVTGVESVIDPVSVIEVGLAIAPAWDPAVAAADSVAVTGAWVVVRAGVALADPEGLAEQAHARAAVEALPVWEDSVAVAAVAALAVVVVEEAVALVVAAAAGVVAAVVVVAAEAEGGKRHEKYQDYGNNRSFLAKPILVVAAY